MIRDRESKGRVRLALELLEQSSQSRQGSELAFVRYEVSNRAAAAGATAPTSPVWVARGKPQGGGRPVSAGRGEAASRSGGSSSRQAGAGRWVGRQAGVSKQAGVRRQAGSHAQCHSPQWQWQWH
ncbi:hypothetical protein HaLaN_15561 [Haematococcus lacustris]|uniref:Uncharacterized protein n=1 Tax=Haematococcus lacustris TaxID=44745 RepID=A0A699Z7V3_HAELA|nr:hypothetical protein HaLaN_15561 [Haematococcus lacustris]